MASLNLVPNPTVLAVQAGLFLVNCFVVKKLYVEPYLRVRDRREALTVGSKDEAVRALSESDALAQKIEARISAAMLEAKAERERIRQVALANRDTLVADATAESRRNVEAVERQIQQEVAGERLKIPQIVASLTAEVYKLALA